MKLQIFSISTMFFLGLTMAFSQEPVTARDLIKISKENYFSYEESEEKYQKALKIEEQAVKLNSQEAELWAIFTQCNYFKQKNDFENRLITARKLFKKADSYHSIVFKAIAKNNLFEAYAFNNVLDEAFKELQLGMKIIDKANPKDSLVIITKTNLLISCSNYYDLIGDPVNTLKHLKIFHKEVEKIDDEKFKYEQLNVSYANLAGFYLDKDIDTAAYYAELANDKGYTSNAIEFYNLTTLGKIALKKGENKKAISYFKSAENISGYHNHFNDLMLYDNIIEATIRLDDAEIREKYESKRDSLKLVISESKNKSLFTLLNEKKDNNSKYLYGVVIMIILLILLFLLIRKNRILSRQEKVSQAYLKNASESHDAQDYSKLLEMLKNNDPAFITYFDEVFPDFSKNLQDINPKIIQSEIEFCALLKLKVPSKDIAKYKYIEHKTVQNKKYLIRKKLNVPKEIDIYQWFDTI